MDQEMDGSTCKHPGAGVTIQVGSRLCIHLYIYIYTDRISYAELRATA